MVLYIPGFVSKKQKKQSWVWKSYLEASYGPGNLLNVKYGPQLLCHNNRLPNQLLLSSELGRFELQSIKNQEFPYKSLIDFL